ncbi:MAG: GGDEF domain-containing protein [Dehalococcoidia bacterium]|nr:GGDEF domain-containing protein [Dehalococcoidia bacterium]
MGTLEKPHAVSKRHNNFYSLILIDVDHFKYLNDCQGHLTGDQSLRYVANVLKKFIRSSNTLGRIGGDEFAILLPQTGIEAGVQVAEKLRTAIESSFSKGNEAPRITISAGVSTYRSPYADVTAETVFSTADKAMYEAKRSGRSAVASVDFGVANSRNAETNVS